MRTIFACVLFVSSSGMAFAEDQTAASNKVALQPADQSSVVQQAPVDNSVSEQSYYGFSGQCGRDVQKSDTAKLLMN